MIDVFLSWSGTVSRAVAELFHKALPDLLPGVEPWISVEDIPKGKPWFATIVGQLSKCPEGIFFLTKRNLCAPWLYYEAGAVAVAVPDASVCAYLLDIDPKDLGGTPFAQMQATLFNKEDTWRLIRDINARLPNPIPANVLETNFKARWRRLQNKIKQIIAKHAEEIKEDVDEDLDDNEHPPDLTHEAKQILAAASQNGGRVDSVKHLSGYKLRIGDKIFCDTSDDRIGALWMGVLEELEEANLIEDRAGTRHVYFLNNAGYKVGDLLQQSREVPQATPNVAYTDVDLKNILHEWFAKQNFKGGTETIHFAIVDAELKIPPGSTKRLLLHILGDHNYKIEEPGDHTARIRYFVPPGSSPVVSNPTPRKLFGRS